MRGDDGRDIRVKPEGVSHLGQGGGWGQVNPHTLAFGAKVREWDCGILASERVLGGERGKKRGGEERGLLHLIC